MPISLNSTTELDSPSWHALSLTDVFRRVKSTARGLQTQDALVRLIQHGHNELPQKDNIYPLKILRHQFSNSLIIILLVVAGLSLLINQPIDAAVIILAIIVNVAVGFSQEYKAATALRQLSSYMERYARVLRNGRWQQVKVEDLVVGDVVNLKAGDRVPADLRLINASEIEVNEASLTGEVEPVKKRVANISAATILAERLNMAYLGTTVTHGQATAVIVATGIATELGKIARLLTTIKEEPTPLQIKLTQFARAIGWLILIICALIFAGGLLLNYPAPQIFPIAVALAVAGIPEGLVVLVTAILAIGMRRILKRQALVRRLMAAETLGSTTVICFDKTGTITAGETRLVQVALPDEQLLPMVSAVYDSSPIKDLLTVGVLNSEAYFTTSDTNGQKPVVIGSTTEKALLLAAAEIGLPVDSLRAQYERVASLPFNSERKYMATLHVNQPGGQVAYLKGAPEKVLNFCSKIISSGKLFPFTAEHKERWFGKVAELSGEGFRILAMARRLFKTTASQYFTDDSPTLDNFTFIGLVILVDPLRPDVAATIARARRAGIKFIMLTGDHALTARSIAHKAGLSQKDDGVINSDELAAIGQADLPAQIDKYKVFARATPQDKIRIIDALQAKGEVVAMTGDGVNDAPALQAADIGVALSSGSDVAKETADMVLVDNNISSIVGAVEEGRIIYDNIRKVVFYLMSDSFAEFILILGAFIIGIFSLPAAPLPILATQILWINLVAETFPALALANDPSEPRLMTRPPIPRASQILDPVRKFLIVLLSVLKGAAALAVFMYLLVDSSDISHLRTLIFTLLALTTPFYAFSCKHLDRSLFSRETWNNFRLIGAVGLGLILQLGAIYLPPLQRVFSTVPLGTADWFVVIMFVIYIVVIIELIKYLFLQSGNWRQRLALAEK